MRPSPRYFSETAREPRENSDKSIRCGLCPRECLIPSGKFGACGVRGNKSGTSLIPFYGLITALALDPIEKKPLYHFRPGSAILSAGFAGCNLRCPFCQNWHISQMRSGGGDFPETFPEGVTGGRLNRETFSGSYMSPGELVSAALRAVAQDSGALPALAYTYSEPLIHAEYLLDCMALARRQGVANVLVTNGCVRSQAAEDILSLTDAANIDLKSFSAGTYSKVLGGDLETSLDFIRLDLQKGVHVEITTLVVPGLNDTSRELDQCAGFIARLAADGEGLGLIPWHLSAYHPEYRWNAPPTDAGMLLDTAMRAKKILRHVYTGNISGGENNTLCASCGAILVSRRAYRTDSSGLTMDKDGRSCRCAQCGSPAPFSF